MGSGTYGLAYIQDVSFFTAKNVLALPSRKYESYSFSTPSFILVAAAFIGSIGSQLYLV